MNKYIILLGVTLGVNFSAHSESGFASFSYNPDPNNALKHFGTEKNETYDVAIKIADPSLIGTMITGLSVNLPVGEDDIKDLSGWLTSRLTLDKNSNVADIATVEGILSDNMLNIVFDTPYEIPSNGVYAGYSFTITNKEGEGYPKEPVTVVSGVDAEGLYVHSSKTYRKWESLSESTGYVSSMTVNLVADFGEYNVFLSTPEESYAQNGKEAFLPVTVVNHGNHPLTHFDYTCMAPNHRYADSFKLQNALERGGGMTTVQLPIGTFSATGEYTLSISIDSFNDVVNGDPFTAVCDVNVLPFLPVTRPLVEEYTGLSCGWCPRGIVVMEEMNETLDDMFVCLSYHSQREETGSMVTVEYYDFPSETNFYPSGSIDRGLLIDPGDFPAAWPKYRNRLAPAGVDTEIRWTDADQSELEIVTTTKFIKDYNAHNFKLAIALAADNLHNPAWAQHNSYSGLVGQTPDTERWNFFTKSPGYIIDYPYNDVVVYFKEVKGIDGAIPANIKAGEELEHVYRIKRDDIRNILGEEFINDDAKVHAVAMILDGNTGKVLNCNKSQNLNYGMTDGTSMRDEESHTVVETLYYDLQGRTVRDPESGYFLKVEKMSDGRVRRGVYRH